MVSIQYNSMMIYFFTTIYDSVTMTTTVLMENILVNMFINKFVKNVCMYIYIMQHTGKLANGAVHVCLSTER